MFSHSEVNVDHQEKVKELGDDEWLVRYQIYRQNLINMLIFYNVSN